MELDPEAEKPPATEERFSPIAALALMQLVWSAGTYATYGLSSFPRQEWLLESLLAALFLIPVANALISTRSPARALRFVGGALLAHSLWDALHWPGSPLIDTPMDEWIPRVCPLLNIPLGFALITRGK